VNLNCSVVQWRLDYARALAKSGDVRHALDEAHACLQLSPDSAAAKALIAELSVLPGAIEP
jgi:hypothetical protein